MNERIRELAEQANGPNPFFGTLKNQMCLLGNDAVEKFAELIIKECASLTLDYAGPDHYAGWLDYRDEILKHFGVEE